MSGHDIDMRGQGICPGRDNSFLVRAGRGAVVVEVVVMVRRWPPATPPREALRAVLRQTADSLDRMGDDCRPWEDARDESHHWLPST